MTQNIFKYLSIFLTGTLVATACTGKFEELNRDPSKLLVGDIEPAGMIEAIQITGTNALAADMTLYGTEFAQVTGKTGNVREEQAYNIANQDYEGRWNLFYRWANNSKHMAELAVAQNDPNYQAIGLIMKVYYLSQCTDLFGSIAYTEAMKGTEGIMKPRIESQQAVYTAMMADLELANSIIDANKPIPKAQRDHVYGGNMTNWKKFANSLHLRLLMRVSGRNEAFSPTVEDRIATIIEDPATYPVFTSNADNASVKFDASATYYRNQYNTVDFPNQNSFNDAKLSIAFLKLTVYDFETGECDPRLRIWGKPRQNQERKYKWDGIVPAGDKTNINSHTSEYADRHWETLVRDDNPNMMMDYAELLFIKAEAAFNGWIDGAAKDYYEQAITASCQRWNELGKFARFPDQNGVTSPVNITPDDITAMLETPQAAYNNTLERIQTQKWISLFWVVGFEMFNEMRRTGYPDMPLGSRILSYDKTGGRFIERFGYPVIALAGNNANYQAAIADQKGSAGEMSTMNLPVWWSGLAISIDRGNPWPHSFRTAPHRYDEDIY
jgi:hypothetical protein